MRRNATMTTILAVGLIATASSAWADAGEAVITEFLTPSATSLPEGVDIGQDGEIWFAETSAGKVAVLRSDSTTSELSFDT